MSRLLIVVALAGILAACATQEDGQNAGSPGSTPDPSAASGAPLGDPSPACAEAFAPLAEMELGSTSDLGELDELQPTVESCESVADWMAGAQQVVDGEIRPGAADLLLRIRCDDPSLSDAPICEELASS